MQYQLVRIPGVDGELLVVHMANSTKGVAVEFLTPGGQSVVITKEQFKQMVGWVESEFERWGKVVRHLN